jgi:hypothetical protein
MPCLSALNRDRSFPLCEVGPVLRFEFDLLASARFDEVWGVSVMVGGPIVGMWIGEVMSSQGGEGVLSLAPSQGFAILGLYYSYRKLFGLSWNFFGNFFPRTFSSHRQSRSSDDRNHIRNHLIY